MSRPPTRLKKIETVKLVGSKEENKINVVAGRAYHTPRSRRLHSESPTVEHNTGSRNVHHDRSRKFVHKRVLFQCRKQKMLVQQPHRACFSSVQHFPPDAVSRAPQSTQFMSQNCVQLPPAPAPVLVTHQNSHLLAQEDDVDSSKGDDSDDCSDPASSIEEVGSAQWTLHGLKDGESSTGKKARQQHEHNDFKLTEATLDRLPKLDRDGYDAVVKGTVQSLSFMFFDIMFPVEAVDLIVKYVRVSSE